MKPYLQLIFISFCFFSPFSLAATLNIVNVEKQGKRYILRVEAQINAHIDKVEQIITDYENLVSINPYLKESNIISISENNRTTANMLTHACVLFICYKLRHVQTFQPIQNHIVYGRIIPNKSDFKEGWSRWTIKEGNLNDDKTATHLTFDTEMVPDFFILPIIGTHHLKKKIIQIAITTINNLEKEAQK